jgi:tetratricopeptide (TPR) repeat protein
MSPGEADPQTRDGTVVQALANGQAMLAGHPDLALRQAQVILSRDPRDMRALRLAAAAHRHLGEDALARRAELVAIEHSRFVATLASARKALRAGEFGEASRLAAEHLKTEPGDLAAITLSAESAMALGLPDKAGPMLEMVLERAPEFDHARFLLANALLMQDRLREAKAQVEQLLERDRNDAQLLALLAKIYADLGDFDAAAELAGHLAAPGDAPAEASANLGDQLRFAGRKEVAAAAYREALRKDSSHGRGWWSLADLEPDGLGEDDVAAITAALEIRRGQTEHEANLHFALGIAYDAAGEVERAFRHFEAGNAARRSTQPYDPSELTTQVDAYLAAFSPGFASSALPEFGNAAPVFIVGMPRSGSTLLERVLGGHSQIEALGELPIVPHMMERLRREHGAAVEAHVSGMADADLADLGKLYLTRAAERRKTNQPRFIDKMHMNWRHLPLILRMLPQATVIDIRRGGMDCCWSNYRTLFSRGHPAADDLRDIGLFYRDYVRFVDELANRVPGRIQVISYESLVDDMTAMLHPLLAAMGLEFEPGLLDFHLSNAPVATASSEQVRKPLNRSGIGASHRYERWLDPLKEALGPLADPAVP